MRIRPASLTAAAPPSSCQDIQSVSEIESSASNAKGAAATASFAPRFQCFGFCMVSSVGAVEWNIEPAAICRRAAGKAHTLCEAVALIYALAGARWRAPAATGQNVARPQRSFRARQPLVRRPGGVDDTAARPPVPPFRSAVRPGPTFRRLGGGHGGLLAARRVARIAARHVDRGGLVRLVCGVRSVAASPAGGSGTPDRSDGRRAAL